ncbi:MAG: HD domain-containing protein [Alphaproteobacteria bacterium]|nr:HD domain-containing protein [Alphaproteobacteria bacterium]
MSDLFAPFATLYANLTPHIDMPKGDGSHDLGHLVRVWRNVLRIHADEGGDLRLLAAATILHDCVSVEKNDPRRAQASTLAADKAAKVLTGLGWSQSDIATSHHAIAAHSFSANITPKTREARILQDADRLDAIGNIGIARCFYVAGRMELGLYDPDDPQAKQRPLDDSRFALDHFKTKLLTLSSGFQTSSGALLAQKRHEHLLRFLKDFAAEI